MLSVVCRAAQSGHSECWSAVLSMSIVVVRTVNASFVRKTRDEASMARSGLVVALAMTWAVAPSHAKEVLSLVDRGLVML